MVTGIKKLTCFLALPCLGQRYFALASPPTQAQWWPRFERKPQPCLGLDEQPPAAVAKRPVSHFDTLPTEDRRYVLE